MGSNTQPHCTWSDPFSWLPADFCLILCQPIIGTFSSILAEASEHSNEEPGGRAYGEKRVDQPGHRADQGETEMTGVGRDFPGGPVAGTLPSNAGGAGSIPDWGAKIPTYL